METAIIKKDCNEISLYHLGSIINTFNIHEGEKECFIFYAWTTYLTTKNLAYTFAQQQIYSVQKLQTFKSIPRGSAQVIFHVLKGSFLSTYRP